MFIKEINEYERPRERAKRHGVKSLSDMELLAILLRTGSKKESVLKVANGLLSYVGGISNLNEISIQELMEISGIGLAKALSIISAVELGRRVNEIVDSNPITDPRSVNQFLKEKMKDLKQEHFVCIYLDSKNKIIDYKTLFIGSLNISVVHPREIFKWAVKLSSAAIVVAHNHPSGDPTPSIQDVKITKTIMRSAEVIGIEFLDHIIIGKGKYISLVEEGFLD